MTAICPTCEIDCRSPLALKKHIEKGECRPKFEFHERNDPDKEKCPICREIWADFLIIDERTHACLSCGCHFVPRKYLNEINLWKLEYAAKKRQENSDRVRGQDEAVHATQPVCEDPAV